MIDYRIKSSGEGPATPSTNRQYSLERELGLKQELQDNQEEDQDEEDRLQEEDGDDSAFESNGGKDEDDYGYAEEDGLVSFFLSFS